MSSTMAGPRPLEQAGGDYYPKLQASVPFTPVTGRRFLIAQDKEKKDRRTRAALLEAGIAAAEPHSRPRRCTSLFWTGDEWQAAGPKAGHLLAHRPATVYCATRAIAISSDFLNENVIGQAQNLVQGT